MSWLVPIILLLLLIPETREVTDPCKFEKAVNDALDDSPVLKLESDWV